MNWKFTVVAVVSVIACSACSREATWEPPSAGLIARNASSIFYIVPQSTSGVVLFYEGELNSSASHTSNPKTQAFGYSGTLTSGARLSLTYRLSSEEPQTMLISDTSYDLSKGRVFVIDTAAAVRQIPLAPLEPSEQYATLLQDYFSANKPTEAVRQ